MNVCLILMMAGRTLIPIAAPFPDTVACEMGGASMTDGRTVRGYVCLPISVYDCTKPLPSPPTTKHQDRME